MGELTVESLTRGWLLNLLVCAGVIFGGMVVLEHMPAPLAVAVLAAFGFGAFWTVAVYRALRRWRPQSLPNQQPTPSMAALEENVLRLLTLVAVVVLSTLGAMSLFLFTPGPIGTDVAVTLGFTAAVTLGTYRALRRVRG